MQITWIARPRAGTDALLAAGVLAGPLFTGIYAAEDLTRPGFSPLRDQVSQLALGDSGWVQGVNFLVTGMLVLAGAAGLQRTLRPDKLIPALVALAGAAFVTATFFPTNPGPGYPPGTSPRMTPQGHVHDLAAAVFFISMSAAQIAYGRRCRRQGRLAFARYSNISCAVMIAALILSSIGMAQVPGLNEVGGLFERLSLSSGFAWLTVLMADAPRQARRPYRHAGGDHAVQR